MDASRVFCDLETAQAVSAHFEKTEYLFQEENKEANAASQRYRSQLPELFKGHCDELVVQFIRADHANTHGIRKGSAAKGASGTTCPPPVKIDSP